jgi:hypothetical protein
MRLSARSRTGLDDVPPPVRPEPNEHKPLARSVVVAVWRRCDRALSNGSRVTALGLRNRLHLPFGAEGA